MAAKSGSKVRSPWPTTQEREQERAMKRDAVLRTAAQLFNERGFYSTSLDDVAARLNVTKPVIYYYFGNKDQVLFECVRLGLEQLLAAAAKARAEAGTGLDRLRAFLIRWAEINMQDFGMCVIRTEDHELSDESRRKFRSLKGEIDRAMRHMIQEAVEDGSAEVGDVRMAAFTMAGALNWVARWYQDKGPMKPEAISAAMVETLLNGVKPRNAEAKPVRRALSSKAKPAAKQD